MKLLEITRSYYPAVGGYEKSIRDRERIYTSLGIKYKIITTDFYSKINGEDRVPSVTYLKQYTAYNITPSIGKYLTADYDIVNINLLGRYYSDYAIYHYANKKQKIILTPYYTYHTNRFSFVKSIMSNYIFPHLISKADAIVAFTQIEKEYWINRYRVYKHKIFVIPPMVEPFYEIETAVEHKNKYLLYIGRAGENKKTDLLIESFVKYDYDDYSLIMTIRKEDVRKDLQIFVNDTNRVFCIGYISESEKQKLILESDGVIFPTSWESFGYAAFEAGAAKLPLLCSDLPVLKESLNENGVIYFTNTIEGITAALKRYFKLTSEERRIMGKHNYENIKKYSFSESLDKYKKLFEHVMGT